MSHLEWKKEYNLDINVIDSQHQYFVLMLNQAYDAFYKKETEKELGILLSNLKDFAILHFGTEEKYFDLFNYENKIEHTKAHNELKEKVGIFIKRFETEGSKITIDLIDFLENWLIEHMDSEDKKYVKCFKEHGL